MQIVKLLKLTIQEWQDDKASRLAAALSYYTMFSLAPLLLVIVSLLGIVLEPDDVQGEILAQVDALGGSNSSELVGDILEQYAESDISGLAGLIGLATLAFGATGVFNALHDALNTIWNVPPDAAGGFLNMIRSRLLSFTIIPVLGFLLLVSLVVDAGLSVTRNHFASVFPGEATAWIIQGASWLASLLVVALFFAAIYKILPDVYIAWSDVWIGSLVTSVLFSLGRFAIGVYIGRSGTASLFGAAGSLIVILLWVYYSAQLVFLGAEFTQVYARLYGSRIQFPDADQVDQVDEVSEAPVPAPRVVATPVAVTPRPAAPASPQGYAITAIIAFFLGALVRGKPGSD